MNVTPATIPTAQLVSMGIINLRARTARAASLPVTVREWNRAAKCWEKVNDAETIREAVAAAGVDATWTPGDFEIVTRTDKPNLMVKVPL